MKQLFDYLLALVLSITLLPVFLILSVAIFSSMGSPVLFTQERPGKNSVTFKLLKFRTMRISTDEHGKELPDVERLTKLGALLRRFSLDEIPSIFNVLKGEMSFVGPRPLLVEYLPLYNERQSRRHDVLPGITGWAQINGRNGIGWEQKFELDVWYVENQSFLLDLKILLLTVFVAIRGKEINDSAGVGQTKFTGNLEKN